MHWIHWLPSSLSLFCLYATSAPLENFPARSADGPLMPSGPSSTLTRGSLTSLPSRVEATDPLRAELPFSLDAGFDMLGEGPGESAAPSSSGLGALGFRTLEGPRLRCGSLTVAVRRAIRIPRFLIISIGSSLSILCSSSASFRASRYSAASSSVSFSDGAREEVNHDILYHVRTEALGSTTFANIYIEKKNSNGHIDD